MDQRYLGVLVALVAVGAAAAALVVGWPAPSDGRDTTQTYPAGAGPSHINFSALDADDANVSYTPREHWDSYAIVYTAPPERRLVEGDYYINASTGAIIAQRWHDAIEYINGSTYAFVQPADSIPNEQQREEFKEDPAFAYDNATDAYYRYDPRYGRVAPTNIGRHTKLLESYAWEASNRTTHHGVPVITYRVTGTRTDAPNVPPAINGTLQLGVEDGIIYGYDITLDADESTYRYTYEVRPAPFPEHEWVDTARDVAGNTTSGSSDQKRLHAPW